MKEYLKCYHVFMVWPLLRVICYVLYPVCMIFMGSMFVQSSDLLQMWEISPEVIYLIMGNFALSAELVNAVFVWGGIATRDTDKLGYLQTSVKGKAVLKKALYADVFRRWTTIFLLFIVLYIQAPWLTGIDNLLAVMLIALLGAEVGQLFIRCTSSINLHIVIFCMVNIIGDSLLAGALWGNWYPGFLIVPAIMTVWMSVQSIKTVMRNERKSYYDEGITKKPETA